MKTNFFKLVAITIVFAMSTFSVFSQENQKVKKTEKNSKELRTVCFKSNLHCNSCVNDVKENITYEKGVKDLKVNLDKNEITITYKADKTSEEELSNAINKLGYKATKTKMATEKKE